MRLSFDQLQLIEDMAISGKKVREIALSIGIKETDFIQEINISSNPAAIAFYRGRAKTQEFIKKELKKNSINSKALNQTIDLFVEQQSSLDL